MKPKNTGVGSLSLLQWIFLTQELNWGLLHCRRILYQLSCEGSPRKMVPKNLFAGQKWRKRQRMDLWTWGEGRRGWQIWRESNTETYITMCKIDGQREFAVCLRKLEQGLSLSTYRGGIGRKMGGRFKKPCIPVADSCWGLTENNKFCKAIILQLRKKKHHYLPFTDEGTEAYIKYLTQRHLESGSQNVHPRPSWLLKPLQ